MSILYGKEILLGVAGGIACYKAVEVLRGLRRAGAEVQVIMTGNAREFVAPLTFQTLSNRPVGVALFELDRESRIGHIAMAERAQLALVAPCTANLLAKVRSGLADDLLSTVLLATTAPLHLALAMNNNMLANAATRENIEVLRGRGVHIIPPEVGFLAEGKDGPGRLAEPEKIVAAVETYFARNVGTGPGTGTGAGQPRPLEGRRVLVTAGPTREAIDPVRFISNRSSGRMGFALAEVCRDAGAWVTLVRGPVNLADPLGMEVVPVVTAEEMRSAVAGRASTQDVFLFAAAVGDYRAARPQEHKIKRAGRKTISLELLENPDIAAEIGAGKKPGQVLVVFAAESQNLLENAEKKLKSKKADLVVANDILATGSGFETTTNRVTLISPGAGPNGKPGIVELPLMDKHAVAGHVVERVVERLAATTA